MKFIVLGAAAGGGYPQWNCRCGVCALSWEGDPRVRPGTQSSLAASGDGVSWTLFNASPDIGAQIRATRALWPKSAPRHSPIAAVVLTNADIDHVAGLLSLRESHSFRIFSLAPVHRAVATNPMLAALSSELVQWITVDPDEPFEPAAGLSVRLMPVPGKAPLYLEDETLVIGGTGGETAAAFVSSGHRTAAYIPGCATLPDDLVARLKDVDMLLFDGTVFVDDEMILAGVGTKTGRRMGHIPITGEGGSLQTLRTLPARGKIYVHINNTNPILIEGSPERRTVEGAGLSVAYDGMELEL